MEGVNFGVKIGKVECGGTCLSSSSNVQRQLWFEAGCPNQQYTTLIILLNYCLDCYQRLILHLNIYLHEHFQVKRPLIKY